jgi:hypothetical protein
MSQVAEGVPRVQPRKLNYEMLGNCRAPALAPVPRYADDLSPQWPVWNNELPKRAGHHRSANSPRRRPDRWRNYGAV